jgi:hypothetical protein
MYFSLRIPAINQTNRLYVTSRHPVTAQVLRQANYHRKSHTQIFSGYLQFSHLRSTRLAVHKRAEKVNLRLRTTLVFEIRPVLQKLQAGKLNRTSSSLTAQHKHALTVRRPAVRATATILPGRNTITSSRQESFSLSAFHDLCPLLSPLCFVTSAHRARRHRHS